MKTIKMPKELGEKWLAALRSGNYKQGKRTLFSNGQYCCLGVLEEVAGELEKGIGFPSRTWLRTHKVNDYKVTPSNKEATHIFADGKVHQIHDNVELWKGILEGVK